MKLFVVSFLVAFSAVSGASVGYPYRSALLSYSPARGAEKLLAYAYPEPLLAVRSQEPNAAYLRSGINDIFKPQNQQEVVHNFRAWCEQRYNTLKAEIDRLRAQGKQPSSDMLNQLKPLEKLMSSTQSGVFIEDPQIRRAHAEHLRLYNEALAVVNAEQKRVQEQQKTQTFSSSSNLKTSSIQSGEALAQPQQVEETPEQKRIREEHLRIHEEQKKQAELSRLRLESSQGKIQIGERLGVEAKPQPAAQVPEVVRATEEHLRLWNEAKQRAEEAKKQVSHSSNEERPVEYVASETKTTIQQAFQPATPVILENGRIQETPEVIRAKEEHLRLWNEAKLKAEQIEKENKIKENSPNPFLIRAAEVSQIQSQSETQQNVQPSTPEATKRIDFNIGVRSDALPATQQSIQDTPEVIRAREEHLKTVNEVKKNLEATASYQNQINQGSIYQTSSLLKVVPGIQQPQATNPSGEAPQPIEDTPEVKKAREEHLRLFNEAQRYALETENRQNPQNFALKTNQFNTEPPQLSEQERLNELERIKAMERITEEERLREIRLLEAERQREAEIQAFEQKMREEERLREEERMREEERLQAEERTRLEREEAERREMERLEEEKRLKEESQTKTIIPSTIPVAQPAFIQTFSQTQPIGTSFIVKDQLKPNNIFLRISAQPNGFTAIGTGTLGPFNQEQAGQYIRFGDNRIQAEEQKTGQTSSSSYSASSSAQPAKAYYTFSTKPLSSYNAFEAQPAPAFYTYNPNSKLNYAESSSKLSQLEKATLEHFKAHELALEQLNLANLNRRYEKDCN